MGRLIRSICFLFLGIVVGFSICQNSSVAAEAYPQKPIQILTPFAPGGPTDIGIRVYADQLAKILKNPVLVVNKPGGGGSVGTNSFLGAKKDGYTLLGAATTPIVCMPIISPKEVSYDPLRDLEPIAHCVSIIDCMVVRGDSPFNTFEDLEKYVKANPGKLNVGVSGIDHPYFIFHTLREQGLDMNRISTTGNPQNVSFLLGGHVDMIFNQVGIVAEQIRAKKMKGLVMLAKDRLPEFPDMPTIVEKGYPKSALVFWIGFFAPKGTPQSVLDVVTAALKEASRDPDTVAKLNKLFYPVDFKPGSEFRTVIEEQQKVIREIAIKTKNIE